MVRIPGFNTGYRRWGGGYQGSIQDTGVEGIPGFNTGYKSRGDTRVQYRILEY